MSAYYIKKGGYSRLWEKKGPLISSMDIELTERCNNNCIHCYINLPASDRGALSKELSKERWKEIIRQIAALGALEIRFTGGEPLIRKDFRDLYLYTRKLGIRVLIFTNATLITNKIAELFKKIPPLRDIEITVYGMRQESYETVTRTPGSFNKFREGIVNLRKKKVPFILKSALLPPNKDEMEEFEKWTAEITSMERKPNYSFFFDLRGRRDSDEKNKLIENLRLNPKEGLKVLTSDEKNYRKEMKDFARNFLNKPDAKLFNCGVGRGGTIDAYGVYQPCLLLRHPEVTYDLKDYSLKEILAKKIPVMKKMDAKNLDYLNRCAKCFLKGLCEQCPAKSWSEHGTLDTPVGHLCAEAHEQAVYLGLLKKGEKGWEVEDWEERIKKI